MEKIPPSQLQEVVFGTSNKIESRRISNLEKQGLLKKIAPRIYTSNFEEAAAVIIKRNWLQILSNLYPGAMLSHRSSLEFKPTAKGSIFLTYSYTKNIQLPGLLIHFLKGKKPLEGDAVFFGNLLVSQEARAFLENLQESRKSETENKTLQQSDVEEKLALLLKIRNEKTLNELRDKARKIAKEIGMKKEFEKLNNIISALLTTHTSTVLTSTVAIAGVMGEPIDVSRIKLFEKLYNSLTEKMFAEFSEKNKTTKAYRNFGFFESYFSNYIEGTIFEIEEAKRIIATETPLPARNEDSHDVLGTYKIVSNKLEMKIVPKDSNHLIDILQYRHAIILSARESKNPGQFKNKNNFAGNTSFVDFKEVRGTLKKGFEYYTALRHPFAKAIYLMFMISEVHPFLDGNGRIARVMMNSVLTANNQAKIIIPTVFREDYMGALRKLTRQFEPEPFIRMMERARAFSAGIYGDDMDEMEKQLVKCDAFMEPGEGFLRYET